MSNDVVVDVDLNKAADVDGLVKDLQEAVTQPAQRQTPANTPSARPAYIEEKYWTGNIEESLQKQHEGFRDLQSKYGRMANDLGAQRRLTDEIIGLKRQTDLRGQEIPPDEPLPKLTASALLERPDAALDDYLSKREARLRRDYETRIASLESQLTGVAMQAQHGDYNDLVNDPTWAEWLSETPERAHLAGYAAQGDTVIASQLIKEFKARKKPAQQSVAPAGENHVVHGGDNVNAAAAAALETAAAGDASSGKIYSRTALMMLKQRNPEVYEDPAFQAEILKAYQEKRVR